VHRHWAILVSLIIGASAAAGCGAVDSTPGWGPPPQLTPPMGWNSWNSGIALTEQSVEDTIDAMVRSGMRDAGYRYVKYDWCSSNTNHADQMRLFTAMRDALRATGRRIIYSINPTTSVDPSAGSAYDWSGIADMTRNSIDLVPVWRNTTGPQGFLGVADQLAAATPVAARSRPGHWNDPDMLVVGTSWAEFVAGHPGMVAGLAMSGTLTPDQLQQAQLGRPPSAQLVSLVAAQRTSLSAVEQRAHFSLWAMMAAPLATRRRTMSDRQGQIPSDQGVVEPAVDCCPHVAFAPESPMR
jgi:alpha-galactosidase